MTAPTMATMSPQRAEAAGAVELPESLREHQSQITQLINDTRAALERGTETYKAQVAMLEAAAQERRTGSRDATAEIAEPLLNVFGIPYQMLDLIAVGPFQPTAPLGPFLPARIIRAGEPAVLLAAVWRNPTPLPGGGANPSAAQILAGQSFTIRGQTVNVNDVADGPDLGPVSSTFGAGFVDIFALQIPSVPAPPDGAPRLLDISLTFDVRSVALGLPPFAGYASRWLQLDSEPPFVLPTVPGVNGPVVVPGLAPGFVNDIPVRVLIYS
jgi:hypothetical protein